MNDSNAVLGNRKATDKTLAEQMQITEREI